MTSPLLQITAGLLITALAINLLASLAPRIGLVDHPNDRKLHEGTVPLVGGLALFFSFLMGALIWQGGASSVVTVRGESALWALMGCGGILVCTGAIDDRFQLGVLPRIASEFLVAIIVIDCLDLRVGYLGDLFGAGQIRLEPAWSYVFTAVSIVGLINAFNMLDGLDGALASVFLSNLACFHILTETDPTLISLFVGASLGAFLISNLNICSLIPKTFLGDAGSRLLGFIVVFMLLAAASGQVGSEKIIKPVTALFLIALPAFDMVFTTMRRIIRKGSPFIADRTHIHHLLVALGFSDRRALAIIVTINLSFNFAGLTLHRSAVAESHQLIIFITCLGLYCLLIGQAWQLAARLEAK